MLLGAISGTVLFVMMMITAVDVAGRYLFSKPLAGGFELTEMMLAALIYCGLPLVSKRREHIVIDTFDTFMSKRVKRGLDILADIVCAVALAGLSWLLFRRAIRVAEYGDTTSVLTLPLAPVGLPHGHDDRRHRADPPLADLRPASGRRRQEHHLNARMTEALIGLAVMLLLSFLRVPIAISMGLVGFFGLWWMRGLSPSMASATTWSTSPASSTRCRWCRCSS